MPPKVFVKQDPDRIQHIRDWVKLSGRCPWDAPRQNGSNRHFRQHGGRRQRPLGRFWWEANLSRFQAEAVQAPRLKHGSSFQVECSASRLQTEGSAVCQANSSAVPAKSSGCKQLPSRSQWLRPASKRWLGNWASHVMTRWTVHCACGSQSNEATGFSKTKLIVGLKPRIISHLPALARECLHTRIFVGLWAIQP